MAALVAFGKLDLAFAREEGDRTHFAQIHANRVVRFVAGVLGQLQIGEVVRFFFFLEVELGLFQDLDAGAVEVREQIFELAAGGGKILGQQLVHFVVENETFFLAHFHELLQPPVLFFGSHWYPINPAIRSPDSI